MCWLADNYYVYCQHHSARTIFAPCIRALPSLGSSSDSTGLSRTGCWNSPCVNHVRVIGFCPSCNISGRDRECGINDIPSSRYGQAAPPQSPKMGGDGHGIPDVQRRPRSERGSGVDGKIWLKSFGGQTPENSRRNSVQSIASGKSASSNPEVRSKSQYSTGANAAWGMTPEELRRISSTLDSKASRKAPNVERRNSLSLVRESPEPVHYRRRRMDDWIRAEGVLIGFKEKLEAKAREERAMEIGGAFFAPYILAATEGKAREKRQPQEDQDAQLRSMVERPCQLLREVRRPHSKYGFRPIVAVENVQSVVLNDGVDVDSVPTKDDLVKKAVSTVDLRVRSLGEEYEMDHFSENDETVKVKYFRKDSAICMDFDAIS